MPPRVVSIIVLAVNSLFWSICPGQDVLFEDTFDKELSSKWQLIGLDEDDYRIREGSLELRLKKIGDGESRPMLRVDLPFATADSVIASVDVKVTGNELQRGDIAGLCLLDPEGVAFSVKKTNIDGYTLLAPGEAEFIGKPGQEGDVGKYAVKYWPADESFGPLRIIVRDHYAYFQVGPSADDEYKTLFHTAIRESRTGMAFALTATSEHNVGDSDRWVRFENFRVTK